MFEIGDKVRIKSWEQMKKEFGLDSGGDIKCSESFVMDMDHLCGEEVVIDAIYGDKIQELDAWTISFDMIEKVENNI